MSNKNNPAHTLNFLNFDSLSLRFEKTTQMKLKFLFLCLSFFSFHFNIASTLSDEYRTLKAAVQKAIESPSVTDSLYRVLKSARGENPLIIGYIGTLEALKAKQSWNPYNKLKYVALSQRTMKIAVEKDPNNLEIRFMRFSIQHYTPAFLGFSKDLEEDRKVIVKQFKNKKFGNADDVLIRNIAAFMIQSDRCLKDELLLFKKYI